MQHLTILASHDLYADRLVQRLDPRTTIACSDRDELADRLVALSRSLPMQPRTLDLIGLTGPEKLVSLNGRPLDTEIKRVRAFFRELSEQRVLAGLGITAIRVVGCMTAVGDRARRTIARLADIVELEVTGTTDLVTVADITPAGFVPPAPRVWPTQGTWLDLDAIAPRAAELDARVVSKTLGGEVLAQIRRTAGVALPALLALPRVQLALPSTTADRFHHLEVLLDYELIRTTVRDQSVAYPVDDPRALRMLLER
jgi:hypothetical protein